MNKRRRRRLVHFALLTGFLLLFAGGCGLSLRSQQRQYKLNRQLIAALIRADDKQALALVKAGAEPNTRYLPTAVPSLIQRWNQLIHHSPPPANDSPTAFMIACGALWNDLSDDPAIDGFRSDDAALVRAMLSHGADIRAQEMDCKTALHLATSYGKPNTVDVLLGNGVPVNAQDDNGWTALHNALHYGANKHIIRQLLEHRADPNLINDAGENALSLVRHENRPDVIALLLKYGAKRKTPDPRTSVPAIARLLGVQVGFNGQDALNHPFGDGLHTTGGHPGGCIHWYTRSPRGYIETDGFNHNLEGLVLESLLWGRDAAKDRTIPFVRRLPAHAGWLGVVYPGMTTAQVSHLIAGRLPAPKRKGNSWTWTAKGFVEPSGHQYEIYTTWTAELTFQKGVLNCIDVSCE